MKKALSVLLIAAACFGFYGSAVTVNDVLACKDYWEEAGEKSTADMNKLEDGLNQLLENEDAYLDGLDQIADAEVQLAEGEKTLAKGEADYAAAPGKLAKGKADLAAGWSAYNDGKKTYDAGKKEYAEAEKTLKKLESAVNALHDGFDTFSDYYSKAKAMGFYGEGGLAASGIAPDKSEDVESLLNAIKGQVGTDAYAYQAAAEAAAQGGAPVPADVAANGAAASAVLAVTPADVLSGARKPTADETKAMLAKVQEAYANDTRTPEAIGSITMKAAATNGLGLLVSTAVNQYKAGICSGIVELLKNLKGNEDAEKALKDYGGVDTLVGYYGNPDMFPDAMFSTYTGKLLAAADDLIKSSKQKLAAADKQLKAGKKELDAGLKKLKKGEKEYAQGLADYKAAPAKLEDGRQQLADGYKQYEDGKAQLAQYEDGEQQIRDGLATLFNTEADLDLVSIADRLNGDGDFDNGDNHLEIEEGLNAVEVGRGYQAEDGDLITAEIMGRAVATGGLLAAGVLAVLAAILSFLNKNKGAGVFAILAAAAGAFGAFFGPAQGTYFSEIAGSTIGTLTWVAAGVLGAVALVHAIVHFAAPKNA